MPPPPPPPLRLLCSLDGVVSSAALPAASRGGAGAWRCALAPASIGFASLSLEASSSSAGGSLSADASASLLVLLPPALRAAHPTAPPAPGGALLWLTGAQLAPPPGYGLRAACRFAGGTDAAAMPMQLPYPAVVVSSALLACEAPPFAGAHGGAQALSVALAAERDATLAPASHDVDDAASALFSHFAAGNAPLALSRPRAPQLLAASPRFALSAAGGAALTLRGAFLEASASPRLACAFGTVSPIAPAWRAGTHALGCVAPARAPSAGGTRLALALPGGWRSDAWLPLSYALERRRGQLQAVPPAPGAAVVTLFGAPDDVAAPDAAVAPACRFGGVAVAAVRWVAAPSQRAQSGFTCAPPPPSLPDGSSAAPRFVTLALTWHAEASASASASALDSDAASDIQFEYRAPPRLRTAHPAAAPLQGGVLIALSGAGFDPASSASAAACTFSDGGASSDDGEKVFLAFSPGVVHSSALLFCEAPAARGRSGGSGGDGEVAAAGSGGGSSGALLFRRAVAADAGAASPRGGSCDGGTAVALSGRGFLSAEDDGGGAVCAFGSVRVAGAVHNATSLGCAAPARAPARAVPLAAVAAGWHGAAGWGATRPLAFTYY
jgi:hypothetical protein